MQYCRYDKRLLKSGAKIVFFLIRQIKQIELFFNECQDLIL